MSELEKLKSKLKELAAYATTEGVCGVKPNSNGAYAQGRSRAYEDMAKKILVIINDNKTPQP